MDRRIRNAFILVRKRGQQAHLQIVYDSFHTSDPFRGPFSIQLLREIADVSCHGDHAVRRCDSNVGRVHGRIPCQFIQHVALERFRFFHVNPLVVLSLRS
jgi:hypothetical protein